MQVHHVVNADCVNCNALVNIAQLRDCRNSCSVLNADLDNLHEFDKLIHACKNDSATNYICHTIHLPAVRAVHLPCDVTLHAQRKTQIETIRVRVMM
jgi:hypothetical protein